VSKPPGIEMSISGGNLRMGVTRSSRAEDKIWEAVEEAVCAHMTPTQFMREAWQAWDYEMDQAQKAMNAEFSRMKANR